MAVKTDADLMVLGHPRPDLDRSILDSDEFHQFMADLDSGGDLRTIQVRSPAAKQA